MKNTLLSPKEFDMVTHISAVLNVKHILIPGTLIKRMFKITIEKKVNSIIYYVDNYLEEE